MSLDFGALPPEITSGWMYTGAGSSPLVAASAAWGTLAAELESAQTSAQTVITELSTGQWTGAASTAMSSAVTRYLTWLESTAVAAQQASSQAMASAGAFEAARSATVPPPVVAANRTQLAALVATNFLGINTPAILATEAHYMEMWAQNTLAMFGYSTASAQASTLAPLTAAPQATNPVGSAVATAGAAAGGIQQELGQAVTSLQGALQGLAQNVDLLLGTPLISNGINGVVNTAAWFVGNTIPTAVSLGHTLANAPVAALASSVDSSGLAAGLGSGVLASATQPMGALAGVGGLGSPVLASVAQSSSMGGLSVPGTWSAATEAAARSQAAVSELASGSGWTGAMDEAAPMGAVPAGMGAAGRSAIGSSTPRYGERPTIMPKQLFA